jgi:hypothetical protein
LDKLWLLQQLFPQAFVAPGPVAGANQPEWSYLLSHLCFGREPPDMVTATIRVSEDRAVISQAQDALVADRDPASPLSNCSLYAAAISGLKRLGS